jgi:hypothetical protein
MNDTLKENIKALESCTITSTNGQDEYTCLVEGTEAKVYNEVVWDNFHDGTGRHRAVLRVVIGDGVVFTWGAEDNEDTAFIVGHMNKQYMKFFKDERIIKDANKLLFRHFVNNSK